MIKEVVSPDANTIFGATIDENFNETTYNNFRNICIIKCTLFLVKEILSKDPFNRLVVEWGWYEYINEKKNARFWF